MYAMSRISTHKALSVLQADLTDSPDHHATAPCRHERLIGSRFHADGSSIDGFIL